VIDWLEGSIRSHRDRVLPDRCTTDHSRSPVAYAEVVRDSHGLRPKRRGDVRSHRAGTPGCDGVGSTGRFRAAKSSWSAAINYVNSLIGGDSWRALDTSYSSGYAAKASSFPKPDSPARLGLCLTPSMVEAAHVKVVGLADLPPIESAAQALECVHSAVDYRKGANIREGDPRMLPVPVRADGACQLELYSSYGYATPTPVVPSRPQGTRSQCRARAPAHS